MKSNQKIKQIQIYNLDIKNTIYVVLYFFLKFLNFMSFIKGF